jgi:hypothetical protein
MVSTGHLAPKYTGEKTNAKKNENKYWYLHCPAKNTNLTSFYVGP